MKAGDKKCMFQGRWVILVCLCRTVTIRRRTGCIQVFAASVKFSGGETDWLGEDESTCIACQVLDKDKGKRRWHLSSMTFGAGWNDS